VQQFNAAPLILQTSDAIAALRTLQRAAPHAVASQFAVLGTLIQRGQQPFDVFTNATIGDKSAGKAGVAGGKIQRALKSDCRTQIDFYDAAGQSPSDWALSICNDFTMYTGQLTKHSTSYVTGEENDASLGSALLVATDASTWAKSLVSDTDTVISDLGGEGSPAVDQGRDIKQFFVNALTQFRQALVGFQQQVQALPTTDLATLGAQLQALGSQFSSASSRDVGGNIPSLISAAEAQFPTAGLTQAFANAGCPGT
jgi:hypothetical protein